MLHQTSLQMYIHTFVFLMAIRSAWGLLMGCRAENEIRTRAASVLPTELRRTLATPPYIDIYKSLSSLPDTSESLNV